MEWSDLCMRVKVRGEVTGEPDTQKASGGLVVTRFVVSLPARGSFAVPSRLPVMSSGAEAERCARLRVKTSSSSKRTCASASRRRAASSTRNGAASWRRASSAGRRLAASRRDSERGGRRRRRGRAERSRRGSRQRWRGRSIRCPPGRLSWSASVLASTRRPRGWRRSGVSTSGRCAGRPARVRAREKRKRLPGWFHQWSSPRVRAMRTLRPWFELRRHQVPMCARWVPVTARRGAI